MPNVPWTEEETTRLLELFKEGKTFTEIGRELGRKRLACLGRYHREMVKRGHVPVPRKRVLNDGTVVKRVYTKAIPEPEVPKAGVGFLLPALAPVIQQSGGAVGLLDVTGCKWPVAEDASLVGGHAFCNCPKRAGSSYCEAHARQAVNLEATKIARRSIGVIGLRFQKRAA